ncbi:ATPase with role in protein import into the ER [Mortierella sp. 14UC]|nr:ATPase with role in protein import into the ER [Mortierella sp. 14UC]
MFALPLLLIISCCAFSASAAATNTHNHELSAITPGTTGLIISDPNIITHHVDVLRHCWSVGEQYGAILAIDLGVSYTTAAYTNKDGEFTLVRNEYRHTRTPTTIAFLPKDNNNDDNNTNTTLTTDGSYKVLFGEAAESQRSSNPTNTIHDWQRWTFRPFNYTQGGGGSVAPEFQDSGYMYKVVQSPSFLPLVRLGGGETESWRWADNEWARGPVGQAVIQVSLWDEAAGGGVEKKLYFRPEELTALLVHRIRDLAEAQLQRDGTGLNITHVVLAIPGELGIDQRQILKETIQEMESEDRITTGLGVRVLRVMTRHHSTAMAYGLENEVVYGGTGAREVGVRTTVVVDLDEWKGFEVRLLEIDSELYETMGGVVRRRGLVDEEGVKRAVVDEVVDAFVKGKGGEMEKAEIQQRKEMILSDRRITQRLGKEVVKVSRLLRSALLYASSPYATRHTSIRLEMESFFEGRDLSVTLSLQQYLDIRSSTLQPIIDIMERLLKDSMQIESRDYVDHVLVSGTSHRIPELIQLIEQYFQGRLEVPQMIDPALTSVHGAVRLARMFETHVECLLA